MATTIEAITYGKELRESVEECMKKLDQVISTINGLTIPDVSQLTSDVDTLKTDMDKVTAIYNYIAGHYTYDTKLASDITSGKVSKYIPDTAATLNSNKGICYDLASLFAAMCRSQDIPCTLTKGYVGSSYHAWNKVNVSGNWYQIDMTYAVTKRVINETTFAGCVSPLTYSQQSDTLAVSAVA